ncbi:MAG: hypothetical protein WD020_05270, partial [Acidimicrobiia bacterium]
MTTEGHTLTATDRSSGLKPNWFPPAAAAVGGFFFLGFGLWAMAGPESFFDAMAVFDPYNQHFVQDIGAFQIGLGAVLVLARFAGSADALAVSLVGVGIGSLAHAVSHLMGSDLGGTPAVDIPTFLVIGLLL